MCVLLMRSWITTDVDRVRPCAHPLSADIPRRPSKARLRGPVALAHYAPRRMIPLRGPRRFPELTEAARTVRRQHDDHLTDTALEQPPASPRRSQRVRLDHRLVHLQRQRPPLAATRELVHSGAREPSSPRQNICPRRDASDPCPTSRCSISLPAAYPCAGTRCTRRQARLRAEDAASGSGCESTARPGGSTPALKAPLEVKERPVSSRSDVGLAPARERSGSGATVA